MAQDEGAGQPGRARGPEQLLLEPLVLKAEEFAGPLGHHRPAQVPQPPHNQGTENECDCRQPRLAKAKASGINSVIPARYRGVSFDRPPVTEINETVVNAIRDWIDSMQKKSQ